MTVGQNKCTAKRGMYIRARMKWRLASARTRIHVSESLKASRSIVGSFRPGWNVVSTVDIAGGADVSSLIFIKQKQKQAKFHSCFIHPDGLVNVELPIAVMAISAEYVAQILFPGSWWRLPTATGNTQAKVVSQRLSNRVRIEASGYLVCVSGSRTCGIGSSSGHFQKSWSPASHCWSAVGQSRLLSFIGRKIENSSDDPQHLHSFSTRRREIAHYEILNQGSREGAANQLINNSSLIVVTGNCLPVDFALGSGLQLSDLLAEACQFFLLHPHCQ